MKKQRNIFIAVSLLLLFVGCKTRERIVERENVIYKTEYQDRLRIDSVYRHDSIYVHSRGDTVFKTQYVYIYKNKYQRDTVHVYDSVYREVPYIVEIPKEAKVIYKQRGYQRYLSYFGLIMLLYLLIRVYNFIRR